MKTLMWTLLAASTVCVAVLVFSEHLNRDVVLLGCGILLATSFVLGLPGVILRAIEDGISPLTGGGYRRVKRCEEPVQFWRHIGAFGAAWIVAFLCLAFIVTASLRLSLLR